MSSPEPDPVTSFGATARGLAKNPLGIIALFLVLVYGLAALVIVFASSLSSAERMPLVIFLVIFPILVLGVFLWLVIKHSQKLYAPRDFRNEENWVRMQLVTVASLTAAEKTEVSDKPISPEHVVELVQRVTPPPNEKGSRRLSQRRILWVDDRPDNNVHERRAFESQGYSFVLATSTAEALRVLEAEQFSTIISDMGREEGPREGYVLLDAARKRGIKTPFFIYAGSRAPEHRQEILARGGNGTTNRPDELFEMVLGAAREA